MAKVRDIVRRVREVYLDDWPTTSVAYEWVTDDSGLLWSNRDLVEYLDEAVREFTRRRPIHDSDTTSICELTILAGQHPTVNIDERILRIDSVQLLSRITASKPPIRKSYQTHDLEDFYPDWRNFTPSPELYVEDMDDNVLMLVGTLAADDTIYLSVQRMPLKDIEWPFDEWTVNTAYALDDYIHPTDQSANDHWYQVTVAGTSDAATEPVWPTDGSTIVDGTVTWQDMGSIGDFELPEIKSRFHDELMHWMLHKAYLKRDSETYDLKASNHHLMLFEKQVGTRPSARIEEDRRRMSNYRMRTRAYYQ